MSSIVNLFSDFNNSTKTKRHKKESYNITPSLNQGENFKKYQKKIKKHEQENMVGYQKFERFHTLINDKNSYSKQHEFPTNLKTDSRS